ncbi:MAG TPA: DUF6445 family protein [Xanthomonadaceae bacterium]|nr:DUF6445 family protein [Xanthomonadaceae bacterium]
MFNPEPRIQVLPITPRQACYVIDDALVDPDRWVEYAVAHAGEFAESPDNAYPGPELRMADAVSAQLDAFFVRHLRRALGARRTLRMYSRLAMTTRAPADLQPRQWLCHVDRLDVAPDQCQVASVLYLFAGPALGGTSFFRPKRPLPEIARLIDDSARMSADEFSARHGLAPGYMTDSNAWFDRVLTVPPRYNRLLFYSGTVFHSGAITAPERLDPDPRRGRLTWNGFFACRRALTTQ